MAESSRLEMLTEEEIFKLTEKVEDWNKSGPMFGFTYYYGLIGDLPNYFKLVIVDCQDSSKREVKVEDSLGKGELGKSRNRELYQKILSKAKSYLEKKEMEERHSLLTKARSLIE